MVKTKSEKGTDNFNRMNKKLNFKNNASFKVCISKIINTFMYNVEDLDIVRPMYNLLEYSNKYFIKSQNFCYYNEIKSE